MKKIRKLVLKNVSIFNEAFPKKFCYSSDVISAISHDHPFTYGQVENEIEKLVHEGVLETEFSAFNRIKLP
ncbi:MAG: hypothetical protein PHD41_07950 [Methanosarcinaceae archaeon]|nr:hypothetical protein [Methanosarcinaceae archaeon]MDD4331883.1 hypothetical protein [Methanosarcinaceae archaeon]MDD4749684.1 hypothetical protein [Methanosarcinaceae archaeon]